MAACFCGFVLILYFNSTNIRHSQARTTNTFLYLLFLGLFKLVQLFSKTSWLKTLAMCSWGSDSDNVIVLIWVTESFPLLIWDQASYRNMHSTLGSNSPHANSLWLPDPIPRDWYPNTDYLVGKLVSKGKATWAAKCSLLPSWERLTDE